MRVGILETGRPPSELGQDYGSYAQMSAAWLAPLHLEPIVYAVIDGVMPQRSDLADIWLVTGSKCGVYETHTWIPPLESFIRRCHTEQVPMIGICFGHQIIAQAMGARVRKSAKGWGVGVHRYDMRPNDTASQEALTHLDLAVFHQDQVETCPKGAEILGGSSFCDFGVLRYGSWALTTQAHPEFTPQFIRALIASRKGVTLPDDIAEAGLRTVHDRLTSDQLLPFVQELLNAGTKSGRGTARK